MSDELLVHLRVWCELQEAVGAEFAVELVQTFMDEAPGMLMALEAAHVAGDAEAFRRAAHSIKSNAMTFGATPLAARARALELGRLADADAAALTALRALWSSTAAVLKGQTDAA